MNIEELRFPIGKYKPGEIKFDMIQKWISELDVFPKELHAITTDLSEEEQAYTYRPGGWTIKQVVHHLADSHMNAYIRFRLALTEENPVIKPYLEDQWALLDDINEVPISVSVQLLQGIHTRLVSLLKNMSVQDYSRTYTHPEHGKVFDLAFTIGMYAWHGRHHFAHIKNAIAYKNQSW